MSGPVIVAMLMSLSTSTHFVLVVAGYVRHSRAQTQCHHGSSQHAIQQRTCNHPPWVLCHICQLQVYPTDARVTGVAVCFSFGRFGAMVAAPARLHRCCEMVVARIASYNTWPTTSGSVSANAYAGPLWFPKLYFVVCKSEGGDF